jgi:peptide chain release factor subunit 3
MISGAAQADCAVLVVSARTGEFEDGFVKGGQTKEHTTLVRTMGVSHIVVAVNKMDDKTVNWSEERFLELHRQLAEFLRKAGFKKDQISFVPMSGLNGINLEKKIDPAICPWYKGDCLLNTLDKVAKARDQSGTQPVRFPVLDRYKDSGKVYCIGRIDGGKVCVGDVLVSVPGEHEATVGGIESEFGPQKVARPGDNVTLWMKGMDENYINSGSVLCSKGQRLCPTTNRFQAQILVSNLPESRPIITKGYQW